MKMTITQNIREFFSPTIERVSVGVDKGLWTVYVYYKNRKVKAYVCRPGDMHMNAPELAKLLYEYHVKKMNRQMQKRVHAR